MKIDEVMEPKIDWKVLLIDDEEDIRDVLGVTLRDSGYEVDSAPDGETGISRCEDNPPHIVITDVRMPGMNGIEVLETVKRKHPRMEVIVATAFGDMDLAVRALQLNASDFITKPINVEALLVAMERAKKRYTTAKQLRDYTRFIENGWSETTRELMETFEYQRRLIESSMDGILGCDADGLVVTFNKSLENMLEYDRKDVVRKLKFESLIDPDESDFFDEALNSSRHGGENRLFLYETVLRTRKGRKIPVQVSAATLMENDSPKGLVCFFRDLRDIRRLEREMADQARILQQDKMMSLGRLAASVAHEINNPLSGILNYIRLMIRILGRGAPDAEQLAKFKRYLEFVEKETDRCSKIVSNLLTFSRMKPVSFQPVDVADLLKRCVMLGRHKLELCGIELKCEAGKDLPTVTGDFNQLQQCVLNLIFNAIDAMKDGGKLEIGAFAADGGKSVRIEVKDNGTGISEEDMPHIFEPFFTTKKEGYGVGLGLSTTYGIVERHNGKITAVSRKGEGTVFTIDLPAGGGR
jgi:two-component system, NtrC family, sensor kinase